MDKEFIEARARDYAHAYLLLCLIAVQKRSNPNFGKEVARSFDEYLGKHEADIQTEFKQQLLSTARLYLKGLAEEETLSVI